jgi:peptidoglycan/xylan/chitin deacetylase (PgdA/CDA1 family)
VSGLINRFNRLAARLARTKVQSCVSTGPILSVSFDDFPKSAWTCGGQILSAHKAAATYYTAGRFCGKTRDDIVYFDRADLAAVVAAGHELGCHTYSHKHAPQISSAELRDDCARNREFVNDCLPGVGLTNFAYPYGDVSARVKGLVARQYATARGIRPGVNISPLDLALLKALPLEIRSWTEARMEALAAEAAQTNGWLILFTHDVDVRSAARRGCLIWPWRLAAATAWRFFRSARRRGDFWRPSARRPSWRLARRSAEPRPSTPLQPLGLAVDRRGSPRRGPSRFLVGRGGALENIASDRRVVAVRRRVGHERRRRFPGPGHLHRGVLWTRMGDAAGERGGGEADRGRNTDFP